MKTKNKNTETKLNSPRRSKRLTQATIIASLLVFACSLSAQSKVNAFCDLDATDLGPNLAVNSDFESGISPWRRIVEGQYLDHHPDDGSVRIQQNISPFPGANPPSSTGKALDVQIDDIGRPWVNGALCELTQNVSAHSRFHVFLEGLAVPFFGIPAVINAQRIWGGSNQGADMLQTKGFKSYLEFDAAYNTPHFLINLLDTNAGNQTAVGRFLIDDVEVYARSTIVDYPGFESDAPPFWNTDFEGMADTVIGAPSNPGTSLYAEISDHAESRIEDGLMIELNRDVEAGDIAIVGFKALSQSDHTIGESSILNVQEPGSLGEVAPVTLWSHAWTHVRFEVPFTAPGREILINTVDSTTTLPELAPGKFLIDDLIVTTYTPGQCP